jgi:hypothetical protein
MKNKATQIWITTVTTIYPLLHVVCTREKIWVHSQVTTTIPIKKFIEEKVSLSSQPPKGLLGPPPLGSPPFFPPPPHPHNLSKGILDFACPCHTRSTYLPTYLSTHELFSLAKDQHPLPNLLEKGFPHLVC